MPLNSQAIATKMGPSKAFNTMDVEIEEIVKEIMEEGGLLSEEVNAINYYLDNKKSDDLQQENIIVEAL